jgi:hypothetical protein
MSSDRCWRAARSHTGRCTGIALGEALGIALGTPGAALTLGKELGASLGASSPSTAGDRPGDGQAHDRWAPDDLNTGRRSASNQGPALGTMASVPRRGAVLGAAPVRGWGLHLAWDELEPGEVPGRVLGDELSRAWVHPLGEPLGAGWYHSGRS